MPPASTADLAAGREDQGVACSTVWGEPRSPIRPTTRCCRRDVLPVLVASDGPGDAARELPEELQRRKLGQPAR
jgi:hypothetical protein